jgi:hypothetical protein
MLIKKTYEYKKRSIRAHELAHTWEYDIEKDPPELFFDIWRSCDTLREAVMERIGREILMPEFSVKKYLKPFKRIDMNTLLKIRRKFNVPFYTIGDRIFGDLNFYDGALIISHDILKHRICYKACSFKENDMPVKEGEFLSLIESCKDSDGGVLTEYIDGYKVEVAHINQNQDLVLITEDIF